MHFFDLLAKFYVIFSIGFFFFLVGAAVLIKFFETERVNEVLSFLISRGIVFYIVFFIVFIVLSALQGVINVSF